MAVIHCMLLFLLVLIHQQCKYGAADYMVGGFGKVMKADSNVQKLCYSVKSEFLKKSKIKLPENPEMYKAIKYRNQIGDGTNYFVKVQVEVKEKVDYCHLWIYVPPTLTKLKVILKQKQEPTPKLLDYKCGKESSDPIISF